MFVLRPLFALAALVSVACASRLDARQSRNTNAQINTIVDRVDVAMHDISPDILTLMASHTFNTATLSAQFTRMENTFNQMRTSLASTPRSSGSTTVTPTNDDISLTLAEAVQLVSASLSGVKASGLVPGFPTMVATFDPILSNALAQFNSTLPGGLALVHTMMLDANQFLVAEGFTRTSATLGF
ncbi:Poxa3b laccase small subunit [Favolaschia claudopus]|uniref:Poxa3b laccase small subunit n=1 Tax=Favolaschia claudopus TaxID=2862362 RepID=A0AAW0B1C3_9AGAR